MRYLGLGSVLGVLMATSAFAESVETVVTLQTEGQPFLGTLVQPEAGPAPVVLMLHGFGSGRDELASDFVPAGVFAHMATKLAEAGFASLRIDFRGSGESTSDLSFADTTFEGQISDAITAMDFLKGSELVDGENLHLLGWSQGGLVAATVAGRTDLPKSVALWNAVGDPAETFTTLFGEDAIAMGFAAEPDKVLELALPWGAEVALKGAFFDDVESLDPVDEIKGYSGALFVAAGAQDPLVLPVHGTRFVEAHEGTETLWLEEMDHVFNIFATDETLEKMIDATLEFYISAGG